MMWKHDTFAVYKGLKTMRCSWKKNYKIWSPIFIQDKTQQRTCSLFNIFVFISYHMYWYGYLLVNTSSFLCHFNVLLHFIFINLEEPFCAFNFKAALYFSPHPGGLSLTWQFFSLPSRHPTQGPSPFWTKHQWRHEHP